METTVRLFAVLCLFNVGIVSSQSIFQTCTEAEIPPMANFRQSRYNGVWYVQEMYVNEFVGTDASNCYTTVRTPTVGGKVLMVDTLLNLNLNRTDLNRTIHYNGVLTFNNTGYGEFVYNATDAENVFFNVKIISTDYTNYAIEWSCWDVSEACLCWFFVMSRSRTVRPSIQNQIDVIIDKYPTIIDKTKIRKVKQDINTCVLGQVGLLGGLLQGVLGLVGSILG